MLSNLKDLLNSKKVVKISNIYRKEKLGVNSGTFVNNKWITRTFNTIEGNADVKLKDNLFKLKSGNYFIIANAPAYGVDLHQIRLYNVTDNKVARYGTVETAIQNINGKSSQSSSTLNYYVTLTKTTKFRLEHQGSTMQISNGLGVSSGFNTDNNQENYGIFGEIQILQLE